MRYVLVVISVVFILLGCDETVNKEVIPVLKGDTATETNIPNKTVSNTVKWHWENKFNKEEVYKIKQWLGKIDQSVVTIFGKYPFDVHFYIHRSERGSEPVPWAHTSRGTIQGVHFHVNTEYTLEEFLGDWTAQHEISHLSIPFIGKSNSWFSEGYATYMQCQVMQVQGVMTEDEVKDKYNSKLEKCKSSYQSEKPFTEVADSLKKVWNYPDMYWGGVSFFWKLDQMYKKDVNKSLVAVMKEYVQCCRVQDSSPKEICAALDEITKTDMASRLLIQYKTEPAYVLFENM